MMGEVLVSFVVGLVVGALAMRLVWSWADRDHERQQSEWRDRDDG